MITKIVVLLLVLFFKKIWVPQLGRIAFLTVLVLLPAMQELHAQHKMPVIRATSKTVDIWLAAAVGTVAENLKEGRLLVQPAARLQE